MLERSEGLSLPFVEVLLQLVCATVCVSQLLGSTWAPAKPCVSPNSKQCM